MTAKILELPGAQPEPSLVDYLENLLTLAKAGEICGMVAVVNHADNDVSWSTRGRLRPYVTVGAMQACQVSIIHNFDLTDPHAA